MVVVFFQVDHAQPKSGRVWLSLCAGGVRAGGGWDRGVCVCGGGGEFQLSVAVFFLLFYVCIYLPAREFNLKLKTTKIIIIISQAHGLFTRSTVQVNFTKTVRNHTDQTYT